MPLVLLQFSADPTFNRYRGEEGRERLSPLDSQNRGRRLTGREASTTRHPFTAGFGTLVDLF